MKIAGVLAFSCILLFTGCYHRPEGPAERIGKGLDEITGAFGSKDSRGRYYDDDGYDRSSDSYYDDDYYDSDRDYDRRRYRDRRDYDYDRRY